MRILVAEDDLRLGPLLSRSLTEEGFVVDWVQNGNAALQYGTAGDYEAIILDVMLPLMDGFEVCRRLRKHGSWSPILLLTARTDINDRVEGLDAGADDYLTKPFSLAELSARLRALQRRGQPVRPTILVVGSLRLDPASRKVFRGDVELTKNLTPREFTLLDMLMRHPGQVLSRDQLVSQLWHNDAYWVSNVVDQAIKYLRRKIDYPFGTHDIETVRGFGYRLRNRTDGD
ncbi:MAG: response regulator transcription factor [Ferrimicrobium sp.]